jgi:REP element-mobilizing transposase RayT
MPSISAKSFDVRNYPQFVEKLRYIHRNPVKQGLFDRPDDWQWSSFRTTTQPAVKDT